MFPFAKHGLVPIINVAEEPAMHLLATYNAEENTDIEWFSLQVCVVLEMLLCDHILLLGVLCLRGFAGDVLAGNSMMVGLLHL